MTAKTKTSVKTFFETGDKPTQAEFVHLIDSYLDYDATIQAIASAAQGGKTGLVEIVATANVSGRPMGTVGKLVIAANTTAALTNLLGFGPLATISQVSAGVIGNNEVTRAKLASGPAGSVLVYDSTGSASVISGSLGQVLVSQGSAKPVFSSNTIVSAATQSEMEAASSLGVYVTPGVQQHHPGHPKAWVTFAGANASVAASYGVTSVTRNSIGDYTVNLSITFSNASYAVGGMATGFNASNIGILGIRSGGTKTATACQVQTMYPTNNLYDPTTVCVQFYGDI